MLCPAMSLQSLPALLRDEPALAAVLGRRSAVLAVPEAARPLALAGLARVSGRTPLLVAVPTGTAAQRLADDLQQLLPRTTSSSSRRGRRCPSSGSAPASRPWAGAFACCGASRTTPRRAGPGSSSPASGRSLQRLGPHAERARARASSGPADRSTPRCCWPALSPPGTAERSWWSTAARLPGEGRSSTSSRRRRTPPSGSTSGATVTAAADPAELDLGRGELRIVGGDPNVAAQRGL